MSIASNIKIRSEQPADFKMVYEINRRAFKQENEGRLVEQIRESKNFIPGLSLVAELDGQLIGHILFSKIKIAGEDDRDALALAPMAVLPEYQQMGIGKQLVQQGIERARQLGFGAIIVLGHLEYYPKFGFEPASKWQIQCPFKVPDEVFMVLELKENALAPGMVKYPKIFFEI